jgi:hypothetical protein
MGKGHASAGGWPWAARGADAEAGQRAGARNVAVRLSPGLNVLLVHCLSTFFTKKLY